MSANGNQNKKVWHKKRPKLSYIFHENLTALRGYGCLAYKKIPLTRPKRCVLVLSWSIPALPPFLYCRDDPQSYGRSVVSEAKCVVYYTTQSAILGACIFFDLAFTLLFGANSNNFTKDGTKIYCKMTELWVKVRLGTCWFQVRLWPVTRSI